LRDRNGINQRIYVNGGVAGIIVLGGPCLEVGVSIDHSTGSANVGGCAVEVDSMGRPHALGHSALIVVFEVGKQMLASAARSQPARRGVDQARVNVLNHGSGRNVIGHPCYKPAFVHGPDQVAVRIEILFIGGGNARTVLFDGNRR